MMSDTTLAAKSNKLQKALEEAITQAELFTKGEMLEAQKRKIREFLQSSEYVELKSAVGALSFYKSYLNDSNLKEIKNVTYFAAITDAFLKVLEAHQIVPTEGMITKLLECASYQKWQEIKGDAWGRNVEDKKVSGMRF